MDCDPNALMQAAKCMCIPSGMQEQVMIYLLQQIAGDTSTPKELMDKAKCMCIPKGSLEEVMAYLLCQVSLNTGMLSGAGSPVDLGIKPSFIGQLYEDTNYAIYWRSTGSTSADWTLVGPTFITTPDINDLSAGFTIGTPSPSFANVVTLTVVGFQTNKFQILSGATKLVNLNAPYLTTVHSSFAVSNCANLANVYFPNYFPLSNVIFGLNSDALTAASVNHILARHVANPAYVSGNINLAGGTSSPPTGQGIIDKATLIGRGVTVTTN